MVSAFYVGLALLVVLAILALVVWWNYRGDEADQSLPALPAPGAPGLPPLPGADSTGGTPSPPPGEKPWYDDPKYTDMIPGAPPPAPDVELPAPPAHEISGEVDARLTAGALPIHYYYKTADGAFRDIADCYDACAADPNCATFTYDANRTCQLADRYTAGAIVGSAGRTYAGALKTPPPTTFSKSQMRAGAIGSTYRIATFDKSAASTNVQCFDLCRADPNCVTFSYNGDRKSDRCQLYNGGLGTIDKSHGKNYATYDGRIV